jgi:hypothetical protein
MRWPTLFTLCASAVAALILAAQTPVPPSKDAPTVESKGIPPRAAPTDYAAHAQAGAVTIAADFTGHNAHTQEGILTTDDFVVIEAGIFGPPETKLVLSVDDFSLRINGGKKTLPAQPFDLVAKSLKDPDYERPESKESKTILTGTGEKTPGVDPNAPPAALPPIPFEVKRGWQQRGKRDSLLIGDRALPQAGLLFFQYGSGTKGIRSIELIYSGPAGKATLSIHP